MQITDKEAGVKTVVVGVLLAAGFWTGVSADSQDSRNRGSDTAGGIIGTGPGFDWEKAPASVPAPESRDYAVRTDFSSGKSLQETTAWLKSALEKYWRPVDRGDPGEAFQLINVKFQGCRMEWTVRRIQNEGQFVYDSINSLHLGDLDLARGQVQAGSDVVKVFTVGKAIPGKVSVIERYYKRGPGALKALKVEDERNTSDSEIVLQLQDKDDITERVGYAITHAARRCGAGVPGPNSSRRLSDWPAIRTEGQGDPHNGVPLIKRK